MSQIKITDLPQADSLTGDELTIVVQAGVSKKASVDQVITYAESGAEQWAIVAENAANSASSQASAASVSAGQANGYAQAAATSKSGADSAAATATSAAIDAENARDATLTQIAIATNAANAASASESAAAGYASTAQTQASLASASASNADADAVATAADRIQTQLDAAATAADRVQTGLDRASASTSASNAATSAASAATSATSAATSAAAAASGAATATGKASEAAASAATVSSMYGNATALSTAVSSAQSSASLAAGYAASASSVVQQDLSGITAQALHRSPNAVTAMFIYDTSKDSDGGAWTEKCQHTSWYNETLYGKWLGAWANETSARAVGGTVGSELVTNGGFDTDSWWTTASGAIANGVYSIDATNTYLGVKRDSLLTTGKLYLVQFKVVVTRGGLVVYTGGNRSETFYASGTYSVYQLCGATNQTLMFETSGSSAWSVDNVSVKEVTALNTASGDYFQLTTDGKFYRLWKNLLSRSNEFDNAVWVKTAGVSITPNSVVAPDGTTTACQINFGATANREIAQSISSTTALTSPSFYAKGTAGEVINFGSAGNNRSFTLTGGWDFVTTTTPLPVGSTKFFIGLYGGNAQNLAIWHPQLEYGSTVTTYEAKTADGSITEVFRGNKAKFPKLAGIVAEASNVTIYDLTEKSVSGSFPMWMRFLGVLGQGNILNGSMNTGLASVCALQGRIGVAGSTSGSGCVIVNFPNDGAVGYSNSSQSRGRYKGNISQRQANVGYDYSNDFVTTNASSANAVAMTVLPDAPLDPVTGLAVPTIAVATGGGVSVIKHNGTVVNSAAVSGFNDVRISQTLLTAQDQGVGWRYVSSPGSLGSSFAMTIIASSGGPDFAILGSAKVINSQPSVFIRNETTRLKLLRMNSALSGRSAAAAITNTFNTGHLIGDIRRAYLSDITAESVSGTELVTNGTFDSSDLTGWGITTALGSNPTISVVSSQLEIVIPSWSKGRVYYPVACVVGKKYQLNVTYSVASPSGADGYVGMASTISGAELGYKQFTSAGSYNLSFVATATTHYFVAGAWLSSGDARQVYVDNISVKEVVADRSYKAQAASITGTLTKSQVATGTSLVAYSGFSAANYLREPYSADLDFGTGEWSVGAWVKYAAIRYNLLTKTEDLGNGLWVLSNMSRSTGVADSKGGTKAVTVTSTSDSGQGFYYVVSGISTVSYRIQFEAKKGNVNYVACSLNRQGWMNDYAVQTFDLNSGSAGEAIYGSQGGNTISNVSITATANGFYLCSFDVSLKGTGLGYNIAFDAPDALTGNSYNQYGNSLNASGNSVTIAFPDWRLTSNAGVYQPVNTTIDYGYLSPCADRSYSSGPRIVFGVRGDALVAIAYDGTTTREVSTSVGYGTATWTKAEAVYKTDGSLAIFVNGQEVAVTRGNPLLTLNNSNAVLTIGNSYALDAPFPGSIALLKLSATAPTYDQALWMYEQEKQLFRDGAQCVLPDANSIVDLSYDDVTDKWIAVSSTNESEWTGLVRTKVTAVPAGSYSKVSAGSGIKLEARTTTNPGVDVTIPAYLLREELLKDGEDSGKLSRIQVPLDYVGGFTATTVTGNTAITSVAGLSYPSQTTIIGATVTGSGIPASTTVVGISGTTIYLSKAATASASNVQISFTDFVLPLGYEAKDVLLAGVSQKEGATAAFTRLFDGFRETIRFGTAPAYNAPVQIQAIRSQT